MSHRGLLRVQAESQVVHQCLILTTKSPIPPVFFCHHHHCLRSQEDTLSVKKRSERTFRKPHLMTWLYISNMQPSFDKSLFRLDGSRVPQERHCTLHGTQCQKFNSPRNFCSSSTWEKFGDRVVVILRKSNCSLA